MIVSTQEAIQNAIKHSCAKNIYINITQDNKYSCHNCSDRTYKQIAAKMIKSERTVDGYREELFQKFKVQSRVGLVLEAIRKDLVKL